MQPFASLFVNVHAFIGKKAKGVKPEDIFFFWCIKIYKVAYRNDYIKKKQSKFRLCLWHLWYCNTISFMFVCILRCNNAAIDKKCKHY